MPRIFNQVDSNAIHNTAACSGATAASTRQSCLMGEGRTNGTSNETTVWTAETTDQYFYQMESEVLDTNDWSPGGTWNVELNIILGNNQATLEDIYVCRLGSNGTNKGTLGSNVGIGFGTGTTGVFNTNITVNATNADAGDRIYIVWVGDNANMSLNRNVTIRPDQQVTTTIASGFTPTDIDGRIVSVSTARADLATTIPVNLDGRTLCHGLTYSTPPAEEAVNIDLTGRVLSASTTRATLSQLETVHNLNGRTLARSPGYTKVFDDVDLSSRTTSVPTTRADLDLFTAVDLTGRTLCHGLTYSTPPVVASVDLTSRTAAVSTTRASLSQVQAPTVDLTGRVLAGRAGHYSVFVDLDLTGRTTSVPTHRATLSQIVAVDVDLTGRTLCHGLTYSTAAEAAVTNDLETRTVSVSTSRATLSQQIGLASRALSVATTRATLSQVVQEVPIDLTGRVLCHGLTYSEAAAPATPTTDLTGRSSCFSFPGNLPPVTNDLTARTVQVTSIRATLSQTTAFNDLTGRISCFSFPGNLQVTNDLTARTVQVTSTRATLSQATAFNDLTGRILAGRAGYYSDFVDLDLTGRTQSTVTSRANLQQLDVELTARPLAISTTRASLQLFANVDLDGRPLAAATTRGTLSQVVPAGAVNNLTARLLSGRAGFYSDFTTFVDLSVRDANLSFPGGTAIPPIVFNDLGFRDRNLHRTYTTRASLSQNPFADLTGRALAGRAGWYRQLETKDLTARLLVGRAGYVKVFQNRDASSRTLSISTTRGVVEDFDPTLNNLTSRTLSRAYTRAIAGTLKDFTARVLAPTTSRAGLSQVTPVIVNVDLDGRILSILTVRGSTSFLPRTVNIPGRTLCPSFVLFTGLTLSPIPRVPGTLRGRILSVQPIGETARPISPRGVTTVNLTVGESK